MRNQRSGFSLIEIMVAMAIFSLGMAVLLQMTTLAQRFAKRSAEWTDQQIICQNILNEISCGIRSAKPVAAKLYDANSDFEFSIHSEPMDDLGVAWIEVSVRRAPRQDQSASVTKPAKTGGKDARKAPEFRLARLIRVDGATDGDSSVPKPETETPRVPK